MDTELHGAKKSRSLPFLIFRANPGSALPTKTRLLIFRGGVFAALESF